MSVVDELLAAQEAAFAATDPLLPGVARPPEGEVLTAALADGARVAGVLTRNALPEGSPPTLWCALETWELIPLIGDTGGVGIGALLAAWREWVTRIGRLPADSACQVTWPSRDVAAARQFLDHGMVPLSVTAVRLASAEPPPAPITAVTVRRAGLADLDVVVELAMAELAYSAQVGGSVVRRHARSMKRGVLEFAIRQDEPVWLAEEDGIAVGLADCRWTEVTPDSWAASKLPAGIWGYINCLSVLPGARGGHVGQQLMSLVHREFAAANATGSYCYYNPPNPLSSVFWPRQGYRPLWTHWEVRPATALR